MHTSRHSRSCLVPPFALAAALAIGLATSLGSAPVAAGVLWVDNANESVVVPLDSPALGISRARMYLAQGEVERAALALRKVVAKFPTATEAHQLLAGIYRGQGKTELAMLHDTLAQRG